MTVIELQPTTPPTTPNVPSSADYLPLRALILERRETLGVPDPGAVVIPLVDELFDGLPHDPPYDLLRLGVRKGLWALAGEIARETRHRKSSNANSAPSRWNGYSKVAAEHRDIFEDQIAIGPRGEWKFLGDCTKADLAVAAERLRKQATGLTENADRYERLGRRLKRDQMVSALDRSKVEEIFNA